MPAVGGVKPSCRTTRTSSCWRPRPPLRLTFAVFVPPPPRRILLLREVWLPPSAETAPTNPASLESAPTKAFWRLSRMKRAFVSTWPALPTPKLPALP